MTPDPDAAFDALKRHFASATPDEFKAKLRERSPEVLEKAIERMHKDRRGDAPQEETAFLAQPIRAYPLSLTAYIATALTGLNQKDKAHVIELSDVVAYICREYDIDPYQPHLNTDPTAHKDVSAEQVYKVDREHVLKSDVLFHLCHFASTGAGEELAFAYDALLPIVLVIQADRSASRMVLGIPSFKVEVWYQTIDELKVKLRQRLAEIRPFLEERKLAFAEFDRNLVGNRIREIREELGLTRLEVAHKVGLKEEGLRQIEENPDHVSNPTLLQLRKIAAVLHTTVADIAEPAIGERLIGMFDQWFRTGNAARYGMTEDDAKRLLRRVLYRALEKLEF